MTFTLDAALHLAAVDAAIKDVAGPDWIVRHYGGAAVEGNSILTTCERRYLPNERALAAPGASGWRVTARVVSSFEGNVNAGLLWVATALDEVALVVNGSETTPLLFETGQPPEPDGDASSATSGPFSALTTYTYIH